MFVAFPSFFLPPKGQRTRTWAVVLLVLAPFLFGALALALGQDANWDLRNYHYYNAYAFLNDRYGKDLLPSQVPYFYNPLMDIPFFLLVQHVSAKTVAFVLGTVQGLNFILLFGLAHVTLIVPNSRHKVLICMILAALGMLGGGGISELGTTFGDNITSLGILLSAALVVRFWEELFSAKVMRALSLALLFGIPSGMMMGLKLPAVIYPVGLCGGLLLSGISKRRGFLLSVAFGVGVLLGCAATLGFWAYSLQVHYGNPVFPYFNDIFHSSYAPAGSLRDTKFLPHSVSEFFLMPFLFAENSFRVGEIAWNDWRLTALYVLLPVALAVRLLFGRNRWAPDLTAQPYTARYLLYSGFIAYLAWLGMFSIYRYAVTLEMIAPLLVVFAVAMLPLKVSTRGLVTAFILLVLAGSVEPGNWTRRDSWLDRFVEVELPDLGDTSNLMVLMAGVEPYSHVIPEFPSEISFVRIESNFSNPAEPCGMNDAIHERVEGHRKGGGRFMILIPEGQLETADKALSYFNLKRTREKCKNVTDRLYNDALLNLCPVAAKER